VGGVRARGIPKGISKVFRMHSSSSEHLTVHRAINHVCLCLPLPRFGPFVLKGLFPLPPPLSAICPSAQRMLSCPTLSEGGWLAEKVFLEKNSLSSSSRARQ
jgi:hypothetical protein